MTYPTNNRQIATTISTTMHSASPGRINRGGFIVRSRGAGERDGLGGWAVPLCSRRYAELSAAGRVVRSS